MEWIMRADAHLSDCHPGIARLIGNSFRRYEKRTAIALCVLSSFTRPEYMLLTRRTSKEPS